MSRDNVSTPERGATWYNGGTIDTANYAGVELEGQVKVFEDINWSDRGVKTSRTPQGTKVACKLVRNVSGAALLPKRLVQLDPANPGRVLGYANTYFGEAWPVDEYLPAAGVPNGDLFWIVVRGPALVETPITGAEFNTTSIAAGAIIGAGTTNGGSTATGTTAPAGRGVGFSVVAATTAGQFTDLINATVNYIGKAMSAMTSGQTNADMLVNIRSMDPI